MSLYTRIQDIALRDFEFLRILSGETLDALIDKVFSLVKSFEGEESRDWLANKVDEFLNELEEEYEN